MEFAAEQRDETHWIECVAQDEKQNIGMSLYLVLPALFQEP